jgi:RES domain-containing protein
MLPKAGFSLLCLDIPDELVVEFDVGLLPPKWNSYPAPSILAQIGNAFIRNQHHLAIKFPSALLQEDKVILLNPNHAHFKKVNIDYTRNLDMDDRLHKNG